jgi:hypothetical protein
MKKTTILMAFVLVTATVTVLLVGLAALPGSLQEAQANPCYTSAPVDLEVEADFSCDFEGIGSLDIEEQVATLTVCKERGNPSLFFEAADFTFTVAGNGPFPAQFVGDNSDGCVDVTIGPGEYSVSEVSMAGGSLEEVSIEGECMQDPTNRQRATGEIQAGETQVCTFINRISD